MNRKDMISHLQQIGLRAIPTVVTFDMGLQYDYITPQGAGTGFGGMGRWPLWRFSAIDKAKWDCIIARIKGNCLTPYDLLGTEFEIFVDNVALLGEDTVDYQRFFSGLVTMKWPEKDFYCLYDNGMWYDASSSIPIFRGSEDEILIEFADQYCSDVETWENMTDEEIESWFDRLSDDLSETTFIEFELNSED